MALCTLLTSGAGFQDMELFGKSKHAWLHTFLAFPYGMPSHDTCGRVFARVHLRRFQACLLSWTQAVAQLTQARWSHWMASPCKRLVIGPRLRPLYLCFRRGVRIMVGS